MKPLLSLSLCCTLILEAQAPAGAIRGFPPEQQAAQRDREKKAREMAQAERIRTYMERMSADPHHAGSPGSRAVAEYAAALMKEWGLDSRIETFEASLPYPTGRVLEMTAPSKFRAHLQEPPIPEDKDSSDTGQLPTYVAYSAAGDVTAPLVYVNYGTKEDYETLKKLGVDVRGKIVIARYGGNFRGVKPKLAAENGAVGCIIYSDPKDDGYYRGDVYPKGPYRPPHGVQRGSIMDLAVYPGDPQSPGWASEKGAKKIPLETAKNIVRIPVLPISYADASPLLRALEGPVAPETWRGAMSLTYHVGPGPASVRLKVDFDWSVKNVHDVIAVIPGTVYKDQWVIMGNHHDAWVNGASDPLSGASSLLETARVLSRMVKRGWKPRRTIVLALWDGEEFGMVGSTEWVEKHKPELDQRAVAYINTDSNSRGSLSASGSPAFEQFLTEVMRDITDPATQKSLLDAPRRPARTGASANAGLRLGPLGSGSDYTAFFEHAGVSSLNLGFGGEGGGVYHSIYDTFAWYQKYGDPDFTYCRTLSQVTTTMLMRLADAPLLPHQFSDLSRAVRGYVDDLQKDFPNADLKEVARQLTRLSTAARQFDDDSAAALRRAGSANADKLAKLNQAIYRTERALLAPQGLPGREWYKHQLNAPGLYTGYGSKTLPGIREALEGGRTAEAAQQALVVAKTLKACAAQIEEAASLLRGI
jgi:N-acetylated-alpha-linked acidic dipeptidase